MKKTFLKVLTVLFLGLFLGNISTSPVYAQGNGMRYKIHVFRSLKCTYIYCTSASGQACDRPDELLVIDCQSRVPEQ